MMTDVLFGPRLHPTGGVSFRMWAPAAASVHLLDVAARGRAAVPMHQAEHGWWEMTLAHAGAGFLYRFRIDNELQIPDPGSHFQPQDVEGPSEVIDHDYAWQCTDWRGRPWAEAVILELHVGTFTPGGTFRSAIERLDDIAATGITAIELMPLADFPGKRNWGYDGVLTYAPECAYGRPDDLRAFIDAAHARGLMVFLDVVYNHFGPEGNYLSGYAPNFFTSHHHTPWGDAIDYRVPQVRAFAIDNVLHWLTHYRFDGLRLDAVHAINEPGDPPILQEISRAVGGFSAETGRQIHLVLENEENDASKLDPAPERAAGKYRAQWNDDYHHAWHVLLTGETGGYYEDFKTHPRRKIARALANGFIYQGEPSEHRSGEPRGQPSAHLPPTAFINFLQNHDQIGNRAYGERLTSLAAPEAIAAGLAVTLLAPSPPMLFMGEEWGTKQPFPFFCDFTGDLADAIRRGRMSEFKAQFANLAESNPPPDPLSEATFRSAVLDWDERAREPFATRLSLVRELLAVRASQIVPLIPQFAGDCAETAENGDVIAVTWRAGSDGTLTLLANLADSAADAPAGLAGGRAIWGGDVPGRLAPWSVYAWIGAS